MWDYSDSRDVGLEAAIIQKVRNSLPVQWFCAENPTGLKLITEATDSQFLAISFWMLV